VLVISILHFYILTYNLKYFKKYSTRYKLSNTVLNKYNVMDSYLYLLKIRINRYNINYNYITTIIIIVNEILFFSRGNQHRNLKTIIITFSLN